MRWALGVVVLAAWPWLGGSARGQVRVERVGQGPVPVPHSSEARELSGLAWLGGERYLAVSDTSGALVDLSITVDTSSGAVRRARVMRAVRLPRASDLEDIVVSPDGTAVLVVDEVSKLIREHALDGTLRAERALPQRLVERARDDVGPESLAMAPRGQAFFVANEDALSGDGERASVGRAGLVRIFRLDAAYAPAGEWAYSVDGLETECSLTSQCRSGVVAMVAIEERHLLVLERALTGVTALGLPSFRVRLYEVELEDALDVSAIEGLGPEVRTAPKRLLFEELMGPLYNYEGMALGPTLDDGSRALLLVSDDGPYLLQAVLALRVHGLPDTAPAPPPPCTLVPIQFERDADQLDASALDAVRRNAACIMERASQRVTLVGHTDPLGSIDYNLALATRRAEAVRDALRAAGVAAAELAIVALGPDGAGDHSEEAHERARRVEVRLE